MLNSTLEVNREPTRDERDGMAWWNRLSESERAAWLTPTVDTAAKAWARYKKLVLEERATRLRVIGEANEYIVSSDDSVIVGAIADLIQEHPHLFAMRFLRVEREVEELRQRLDAAMRTPILWCQEVAP